MGRRQWKTLDEIRDMYPDRRKEMEHEAIYLVHTVNGPVYACEEHKRQLIGLFGFMGAHTVAEMVEPGHECPNCVNEAKANKER